MKTNIEFVSRREQLFVPESRSGEAATALVRHTLVVSDFALATADVLIAIAWVRRLDLALRAPDAINLAIASRIGATLFTFDLKMASAARVLGITVSR